MNRLERAAAALARSDRGAARELLVDEWRLTRAPEIAELVARLDAVAASRLTAELITPRVDSTLAKFRAVAGADDPALARWILDVLGNPPFYAASSAPLYDALVDELAALRDRRLADELPRVCEVLEARLRYKSQSRPLIARLEAVAATLPAAAPVNDPALAAIHRELHSSAAPARTIEALFADVYANPDDDGPRQVLGDALIERGDPRGEFIQLQLARGRGGAVTPRETELLKRHGKQWLGPLATVLSFGKGYSSTRFERGFVARADFIFKIEQKLPLIVDDPGWSTIEEFERNVPEALLARAPLRGLRRAYITDRTLAVLAGRTERLRGVIHVAMRTVRPDIARLRELFPALVEGTIVGVLPDDRELAALAAEFVALTIDAWPESRERFARLAMAIAQAPLPLQRVAVRPWAEKRSHADWVEFSRDETGLFTRARPAAP